MNPDNRSSYMCILLACLLLSVSPMFGTWDPLASGVRRLIGTWFPIHSPSPRRSRVYIWKAEPEAAHAARSPIPSSPTDPTASEHPSSRARILTARQRLRTKPASARPRGNSPPLPPLPPPIPNQPENHRPRNFVSFFPTDFSCARIDEGEDSALMVVAVAAAGISR